MLWQWFSKRNVPVGFAFWLTVHIQSLIYHRPHHSSSFVPSFVQYHFKNTTNNMSQAITFYYGLLWVIKYFWLETWHQYSTVFVNLWFVVKFIDFSNDTQVELVRRARCTMSHTLVSSCIFWYKCPYHCRNVQGTCTMADENFHRFISGIQLYLQVTRRERNRKWTYSDGISVRNP